MPSTMAVTKRTAYGGSFRLLLRPFGTSFAVWGMLPPLLRLNGQEGPDLSGTPSYFLLTDRSAHFRVLEQLEVSVLVLFPPVSCIITSVRADFPTLPTQLLQPAKPGL